MQRVGIFGGTFNPPHNGHLRLAREFASTLKLDKVLIIPAYIPPHKLSQDLASTQDRLELCRLCFSDSIFEVSTIEIDRGGKSYTYDTLTQLRDSYPETDFFLIIGSDMLLSFHEWYQYEEILKLCTICAASREQEDDTNILQQYVENVLAEYKNKVMVSPIAPLELSSTQIRKNLKSRKNLDSFLPNKVLDYIVQRGLYTGV